ncbi:hypothetical protein C8J57DRAFT_1352402 [Mycena rebaudengoi]|nr:hypothetical protein C8J57DRAFT_1352402 [Mycena rebaudengoi]
MSDELPPSYQDSFVDAKDGSTASKSVGSPVASTSKKPTIALPVALKGRFGFFRKPHSTAQVTAAVLDEIHTLVQPSSNASDDDKLATLESIAGLCTRQKIDLGALLRQNSIGNHTALYWTIVNHPPGAFVAAILRRSAPLAPDNITEAKRACIALSSQDMFHFLRSYSEFGVLSVEDKLLLGVTVPPDEIAVKLIDGPQQAFSVQFKVPQFHKRMRISKSVQLHFIARDRMWELSFFVADKSKPRWLKEGGYSMSFTMLENSPATYLEFAVVIDALHVPATPAKAFSMANRSEKVLIPKLSSCKAGEVSLWSWPVDRLQIGGEFLDATGSLVGSLGAKLGSPKPLLQPPIIGIGVIDPLPSKPDEDCVIC